MPNTQRFLSIQDLQHMPAPRWAIEGLFEVNSLTMLAGPEASYKSFLALDWMLCMASGRKWLGKETAKARVLYVLGEGKASLLKRVHAWMQYNNVTNEEAERIEQNFKITFNVPQLARKVSVDLLLEDLRNEDYEPTMIVVDTFARSFVGLDENSQQDTGMWIDSADRLRQLGYTVLFIHHTAKNTEFGFKYRGSTAIAAAMDSSFVMHKDGSASKIKFFCTKQKDHDEGQPMWFKREIVRPRPDAEGSIVLVPSVDPNRKVLAAVDAAKLDELVASLLMDPTFESDRSRARELSKATGLTEDAAQSRIRRGKDAI